MNALDKFTYIPKLKLEVITQPKKSHSEIEVMKDSRPKSAPTNSKTKETTKKCLECSKKIFSEAFAELGSGKHKEFVCSFECFQKYIKANDSEKPS